MTTKFWIRISILTLLMSAPAFARNCDQHCLEQLLAQITTLRSEIKSAIPIGTILPYSGSQAIPQGYISCNGQLLQKTGAYHKLFEIIGDSFTGANEKNGTHFRVPNLNGKTLVGTRVEETSISLGDVLGSETQVLTAENLPHHQHTGTTESNNRGHTHAGRTGDDSPDHTHTYMRHNMGLVPVYNGVPLNGGGSHHNIADNGHGNHASGNASTRHQHDFTSGTQSQNHEHTFTTNHGIGLNSTPISVMQPSLGVRFMIKSE